MVLSRPLLSQEHLLLRVDHDRAGGPSQPVDYVVERPAGDGLPEVIRIVDDDEEGELEGIFLIYDDELEEDQDMDSEEEEEEEEEEEDSESEEDWTSDDSGYSTMTDDEDLDVDDDVGPRSPLNQQMPPEEFWQGWRRVDPPVPAACPHHLTSSPPQVYPRISEVSSLAAPCSSLAQPPLSQRSEEPAPSTSGHSSATKRSREEADTEQVSTKRQRWNFEESLQESAPSTSGLGRFTNRSREEDYRESAPSTSGLGPSTSRRHWLGHFQRPRGTDDSDSD